jgi:anion-transporting  ArsA/GET3 family ATPase
VAARSIYDKHLVFVTGKGGVGRSTVAAAFGLSAVAQGKRVLLVEVAEQDRLSRVFERAGVGPVETELTDGLWAVGIDMQDALKDWLRRQLGGLYRILLASGTFQHFVAAAPGGRELITIGKIWDLAQAEGWDGTRHPYDLIVVDAPASGHGLAMLRAPRTFADIARVGPIRRQADKIWRLLTNPKRTAYLAVALPEEMPVNETVEFEAKLAEQLGMRLDAIVVNGVYPQRFKKQEAGELEAALADGLPAAERAALAAAISEDRRTRGQQAQVRRLRKEADARVVTLPFLFVPQLDRAAYERLGAELSRRLAQPAARSSASPSSTDRTGE